MSIHDMRHGVDNVGLVFILAPEFQGGSGRENFGMEDGRDLRSAEECNARCAEGRLKCTA